VLDLFKEVLVAGLLPCVEWVVIDLEVVGEEVCPLDAFVLEFVDQLGDFLDAVLY
jgi:hypothetical protein